MHFAIPEGTTSITQPDWIGKGHDSWEEWGVNKEDVTSVTIPTSVIIIGMRGFDGCSSLISVAIPSSVASIGHGAFRDCSSLTIVAIPASVTRIKRLAFIGCSSLASLAIPASVTSIGSFAFAGCSSLASVEIPASVTSIQQYAFQQCSSLACVTISTSTTTISAHAFARCGAVAAVVIKPAADNNASDVAAEGGSWGELAGNVIADDPNEEYDDDAPPPTTIARLWAPDCIIKQLAGPFAAYNKFTDLPRAMRVAPDAKTWAAVELWQWWAAPTHVGEDRLECLDRRRTVFAVMLSGARAEGLALLPRLPEELWLYTFSFLKHAEAPTYT